MKYIITSLSIGSAVLFSSCAPQDPAYAEWKRQQAAGQQVAASGNNPYGAPAADPNNPYAAPSMPNSGGAEFQQLPALPNGPSNFPVNPPTPYIGNAYQNLPSSPVTSTIDHTVVSGDTVWGLSKKYNTSQNAILQANGLTSSNIRIGQVIKIPAN